jgi:hypothetical protein
MDIASAVCCGPSIPRLFSSLPSDTGMDGFSLGKSTIFTTFFWIANRISGDCQDQCVVGGSFPLARNIPNG